MAMNKQQRVRAILHLLQTGEVDERGYTLARSNVAAKYSDAASAMRITPFDKGGPPNEEDKAEELLRRFRDVARGLLRATRVQAAVDATQTAERKKVDQEASDDLGAH